MVRRGGGEGGGRGSDLVLQVIKAGGGHEDQSWFRIEDWRGHWGRRETTCVSRALYSGRRYKGHREDEPFQRSAGG